MFNNFLYVYGPCVCNKDILLLLLLYICIHVYREETQIQF